jgi:hypothetical protein
MKKQQANRWFPPLAQCPPGLSVPYYYGTLSSFMLFFKVERRSTEQNLRNTGFKPARFVWPGEETANEKYALSTVEFQNYAGHLGTMIGTVNEVEFNIAAYPAWREAQAPVMRFRDYVRGDDSTKILGGLRLHVAADNPFAVAAGQALYCEPKFSTTFHYKVPTLNLPDQKTWHYICNDPRYSAPVAAPQKDRIFTVDADIRSFEPLGANPSPFTLYSSFLQGQKKRPLGCIWNIFGAFQAYFPEPEAARKLIRLTVGQSPHAMTDDMRRILTDAPVVGVRTFQSTPCASAGGGFFVDVEDER